MKKPHTKRETIKARVEELERWAAKYVLAMDKRVRDLENHVAQLEADKTKLVAEVQKLKQKPVVTTTFHVPSDVASSHYWSF